MNPLFMKDDNKLEGQKVSYLSSLSDHSEIVHLQELKEQNQREKQLLGTKIHIQEIVDLSLSWHYQKSFSLGRVLLFNILGKSKLLAKRICVFVIFKVG